MEATDVYGLVRADRIDHLRHVLARQGVHDDAIRIHPVRPGRYQLHDEMLHTDAGSARRGLLAGLALGAAVGLLASLLLAGVDDGGRVVAITASAAGFGALVGAMWGLQRVEKSGADPVSYHDVGPDDGVVLVEVHHEHWHNRVHRILERHGAVFLQEPTPA